MGSSKASSAAKSAAETQSAAQKKAISEQARQFDSIRQLLAPYVQAGQPNLTQPYVQAGPGAVQGMQALAGVGGEAERQRALYELQQSPQFTQIADIAKGNLDSYLRQREADLKALKNSSQYKNSPAKAELLNRFDQETQATQRGIEAKVYADQQALIQPILQDQKYEQLGAERQRQAIQQIEQGPLYKELAAQGESAMLQNAASTGGLRGGNVQGALAQFRPALLNQLIESQYGKLAGLTTLGSTSAQNLLGVGQASAAGTGALGMQSAQNIGNLQVGLGQAQAAGTIGAANAYAQGLGSAASGIGGGLQNIAMMKALGLGGTGTNVFGGGSTALSLGGTPLSTPIGTGGGGWSAAQSAALAGQ